jgi:hypothetical protein
VFGFSSQNCDIFACNDGIANLLSNPFATESPCSASGVGEGMVETVVLLEPHRKAVRLVHYPTVMVVIGVGAFLLFVSKTVGAQELSTGIVDTSGRASMERAGFGGVSYPAAATQNGRATASPGQWLIDDVARERAKFELRQGSPQPLSATNAAREAAHVEAAVRLPSSDDTRAGGDERRAEELTSSISAPPAEDGTLGTRRPQRALKRSDDASPRPVTSRGLVDSAAKCIDAPVGMAPEGERWYYRLDRETHRKCWHVRAFREDRAPRRIVESDRRPSERTSADPFDSAWAWWYWQ